MKRKKRLFNIAMALMVVFTISLGNLPFVMAQTEGQQDAGKEASAQQESGTEAEPEEISPPITETRTETTEETADGEAEEPVYVYAEDSSERMTESPEDEPAIDQKVKENEKEDADPLNELRNGDEKINVSGVVKWSNRDKQGSSQRPTSVDITLYANEEAVSTKTVSFPGGTNVNVGWPFSFDDLDKYDNNGEVIRYSVRQSPVNQYETTYSSDTFTITNTYIGGVPNNHIFNHIDVRIAGPQLEVNYQILDPDNNVVQSWTENITASVTGVRSVSINGTTYTGFTQSGSYEFRKTNGVSIRSSALNSSSTAVLLVDLRDTDGNVYENVEITYGLGGIMDAAYNCDGYSSNFIWESFSGLDFEVGDVQNYNIVMRSYALQIDIQKYLNNQSGSAGAPWAYSGDGGEFGFTLEEQGSGRSWTVSNDAQGKAQISITYPFSSQTELEQYASREYTYTLKETACSDEYIKDDTTYTFTVGFTLNDMPDGNGKSLTPYIKTGAPSGGTFAFTNLVQQKTGSLKVTKTVAGNSGDKNKEFSFSVTLNDAQINGTYGDLTFREGVAEFSLKDGESATASELPAGTGYEVTERDYTSDGYITSKIGDTGMITEDETATAAFTNSRTTYTIYIHKTDDRGRPLNGAIFDVVSSSNEQSFGMITTDENGDGRLSGLPLGDYTLVEQQAPVGFELGRPVPVAASDFDPDTAVASKTIVNYPIKINIPVIKQWVGTPADAVTFNLTADGEQVQSVRVTEDDRWQYLFEGLNAFDHADGHEIIYNVTEEPLEGYTSGRSGTAETGFTFTNTITGKVSVPVTKAWIGQAAERVTINLLANGDKIDDIILNEGNGWQYTFAGLDKYDKEGKAIEYTVTEEPLEGYTTSIRGNASDGFTVINTQDPKETEEESGSGPKTGDEQKLYTYLLIIAAAGAGLLAVILIKRRRRRL